MNFSSALLILAAIVLGVLKVSGTLSISWWLVAAPIWIPIVLTLMWILFLFLFAFGAVIVAALLER